MLRVWYCGLYAERVHGLRSVLRGSADDIASQKSSIEAENEQLEQELEGHNQELAEAEELTGKLDDVDNKIEDLTSGGWARKILLTSLVTTYFIFLSPSGSPGSDQLR